MVEQRKGPGETVITLILVIAAALVLLPMAFMLTASFMPRIEILTMPYRWIPSHTEWKNFYNAVAGMDGKFMFVRNVFNSLFVSLSVTFSTVILASLTGYALVKFRFRGRNLVFMGIMATMMIPFETIMAPLYMTVLNLGIQNSYRGLIFPFLCNAMGVFMMRQYLQTFPTDVLDAARIDGENEPLIFVRMVLPNSVPAIASLAVLTFRQQWDNLLWPLMVAQDNSLKTIPMYVVSFAEEKFADEGAMMAVALFASLPVVLLFVTLSKYFVGGAGVYSAGKE
jgi:multiple sugar transport system permease protein